MSTAFEALTENKRVGREVRAWMGRADLRQIDIARVLGVAQKNVSQRLRGTIPFRVDELMALASYLGISLGQLLGDEIVNEKKPHRASPDEASIGSEGETRTPDLTIMSIAVMALVAAYWNVQESYRRKNSYPELVSVPTDMVDSKDYGRTGSWPSEYSPSAWWGSSSLPRSSRL